MPTNADIEARAALVPALRLFEALSRHVEKNGPLEVGGLSMVALSIPEMQTVVDALTKCASALWGTGLATYNDGDVSEGPQ